MDKSNSKGLHYDVIIIGAGISGIDAGYHLNTYCPWANYTILERRANLGGTWDFFKYPGIRSDSDMYTFGFSWKIWKSAKPIAPAEDILEYLNEAAKEQNIMEKIKFNTDIKTVIWSSNDKCWYLTTTTGLQYSCNTIFGCTGYYSYEHPYIPTFKGEKEFKGKIVHPQQWTSEDDALIVGKKVAIIGSGATAVTLLPNISEKAEHVTVVQRTPSYIGAKPDVDRISKFLSDWLPQGIATKINRWRAVIMGFLFFQYCSFFPESAKRLIKKATRKQVKSVMSDEEFEKHFTPPYNPWEQRFCLAPDGDFFEPIRKGKATMVTDHIDSITENGIKMKSGKIVEADFIVRATGLTFQPNFPFSTMEVSIDGEPYKPKDKLMYKSVMLSDVPNFAFVMGYTNASWTLKADIACSYFCKLLNYMKDNNYSVACPRIGSDISRTGENMTNLSSGYLTRAMESMPKQGNKYPWRTLQNYFVDSFSLWWKGIKDDSLEFTTSDKKSL